eukprot:TRINITY_DN3921_c0_g1_i2.p1 TRINITY_DN3921_c0_g1~~TRINITY_DN3921_c0_g1_i2.p1  ORF type:complete len:226 (+),score=19.14 TRINITY_DN3921_c0_g1_i2:30-680(+)
MGPVPGWRGRRRKPTSWQPAILALSVLRGASGQSSGWGTRSSYDSADLGQHVCDGHEVQWSACPAQPACHLCQPIDCVFSKWSEWFLADDCTGLRFRHRGIELSNNKCGLPCYGSQIESEPWVRSKCMIQVHDCILSVWGQWSECKDELGQSVRSRHVERPPSNLGAPCRGTDFARWPAEVLLASGTSELHSRTVRGRRKRGVAADSREEAMTCPA